MDFSTAAVLVGVSVLGVSSYFDFRTREVENYITIGFIVLAAVMQLGFSLFTGNFAFLQNALLVGGLFFAFGWVMFQTGQWGGADTKLLAGMGVLFANFAPVAPWPFAATLFVNIFLSAFAYTILYSVYLTWQEPSVISEFQKSVRSDSAELLRVFALVAFAVFAASGYVFWRFSPDFFTLILFLEPLFSLLVLVPVFWGLVKFARALENKTLRLKATAKALREFDLLTVDILRIGKKVSAVPESESTKAMRRSAKEVIYDSTDPNGLTLEQIAGIQKLVKSRALPDSFVVKWGLPFVPVFLIAVVMTLYFGDIVIRFI